jgi:hypothetical protein
MYLSRPGMKIVLAVLIAALILSCAKGQDSLTTTLSHLSVGIICSLEFGNYEIRLFVFYRTIERRYIHDAGNNLMVISFHGIVSKAYQGNQERF